MSKDALKIVEELPTSDAAIACLSQYYGELSERFAQGFEVELSCDPQAVDMMRPRGVFLLVYDDVQPIGCVGVKGTDRGYAEIKRLWVAKAARGQGVAAALMEQAEKIAAELKISLLRLDTNSALPEASAFYRKHGWHEIERFNDDPYPDQFFEKQVGTG